MNSEKRNKLLLVEDEALIAMDQKRRLQEYGYETVMVHSGEKAVELLRQDPEIELVLMDIDLGPGMDGTQAAEEILSTRELPLIFLSSHTEREIVEKTEGITSYGYVVKTSGITVLDAAIKMAFRLFEAQLSIKQQNMRIEAANEELRVTNEELQESRDRLEAHEKEVTRWKNLLEYIVRHDSSAIAVLDGTLRFLYVSERFVKDYGVSRQEVVGRHHYEVFPDIPEKWREVHRRALKGEVLGATDDLFPRADGSLDYTTWECRPWYESDGSIGGIILYTEVVTERVLSHERYRLLAENARDLIYRYDLHPEPHFAYVSPSAEQITGYTAEEHYQDPQLGFKLVHPEDRHLLEELAKDPARAGEPLVLRWQRKDGTIIWTEQVNSPIQDPSGNVVGIEGIARDITERKEAEIALEREEAYLQEILQSSPDGFWLVGDENRILDANEAYARMSGYSRDELLQLTVSDIDALETEQETMARRERVLSRGYDIFETEHRRKDGSRFHVEVSVSLLRRHEGVLACFCRDITERRKAMKELQETRWRLESIIEATRIGTWEWNVQTGEATFNSQWAKMAGYTLDELRPLSLETWTSLAHPDDLERSDELLRRHFAGEIPYYEMEARVRHKEGHWIWVLDRGQVITRTAAGEPALMFGTHTEITERKKNEERVQELLQEKELILREVHHRIKNNMNTMMSLLSLEASAASHPDATQALTDARSRLQSMEVLYERLYRSGDYRRLSLNEYLLPLAREVLAVFPGGREIELIDDVEPLMLKVDTLSTLGIILTEVITNSMKYAFEEGEGGELFISAHRDDGEVALVVADNGVGLPDSFNLDDAEGFGMSLIKALAEQLSGSIGVEGVDGTRYVLRFPVSSSEA